MVLTFGPLLGKALRLFWESVFGFLAAIFADLRKVALDSLPRKGLKWGYPYSLGILTEWKLNCWFRRLSFPASTASYRAIPLGFWSLTTDKEIWRSL